MGTGARWIAFFAVVSILVVASCGSDDASESELVAEGPAPAISGESPATPGPANLVDAANPIASENTLAGTSAWRITSAANGSQLEGYASVTSVQHGDLIPVHVRADVGTTVRWDLYRMGYYGGQLGRLVATGGPFPAGPQPAPSANGSTGLVECRWPVSFSLRTDVSWASGFYLIKLTRADGRQTYVPIVLRADERKDVAVVQLSVTTWQAYNTWGGESLYGDKLGLPGGHAYKVSFNRPYADGNGTAEYFWFEHYFQIWAESKGYDLGYVTNVDVDRDPSLLERQRLFLSVGHDEYWPVDERNNVQAALDKGVNLAFLSADSAFWQIRLEQDSEGTSRRTEVSYKEQAVASDPLGKSARSTVQFREPPVNRPENALLGVMSEAWELVDLPWVVRGSGSWLYEGTGVADGDSIPLIVGYESDKVFENGNSPVGLSILAASPVLDSDGRPTWHNGTLYTAASGAFVFAAGAHRWSFGLSYPGRADVRLQRMTENLFTRAGLTPALAGSDFGARVPRASDYSSAAAGVATLAGAPWQEGLVNGPSAAARFRRPAGVAVDSTGNIYVADTGNHVIRKIANDAQRTVTTVAGTGAPGFGEGAGLQAALNAPQGITVGSGGALFVADTRNNRIVRIARDPPYTVSTWAGSSSGRSGNTDGNGTSGPRFFFPMGIVAVGSDVYVADTRNSRLRRIDSGRNVTTVVGAVGQGLADGSGGSARMKWPSAITVAGGTMYVVDTGNRRIRSVALDGAYTTRTLAGSSIGGFADGTASSALLMPWGGIAVVGSDVFIADTGNSRIRVLRAARVTTYAGDGRASFRDGAGAVASFSVPMGLAALPDRTLVVVNEGSSIIGLVGAAVVVGGGGGGSDAGPPPDGGTVTDGGLVDAGVTDGGALDAGTPDAGIADGGAPDAGSGPKPPNAILSGGPFSGRAPLQVYLDGTATRSSKPGGWISRFAWDLGDGTASTRGFLYQTYSSPGRYRVVLRAFDESGRVGTAEQLIIVN
jgi:sugar lactone lactonase YvrE